MQPPMNPDLYSPFPGLTDLTEYRLLMQRSVDMVILSTAAAELAAALERANEQIAPMIGFLAVRGSSPLREYLIFLTAFEQATETALVLLREYTQRTLPREWDEVGEALRQTAGELRQTIAPTPPEQGA